MIKAKLLQARLLFEVPRQVAKSHLVRVTSADRGDPRTQRTKVPYHVNFDFIQDIKKIQAYFVLSKFGWVKKYLSKLNILMSLSHK